MNQLKTVRPQKLKQWLEAGDAILIDVREVGEHQTKAIQSAINIPLSEVTLNKAHIPEHRHKKLVLHCQTGRRSQLAGEKLLNEGANCELYHLEGGIVAWESSGLSVVKSGRIVLPLDRQIQFVVSLLILFGLALGWLVNPWGYLIPTFIGFGLMMASLTGWCGLTQVLKIMPWNRG